MTDLTHLDRLEAEAIQILRDGVAQADRPVLLFSGGKDSTVLAHLALEAFHPSRPPMPLLHVDSTWEFREVVEFRNRFAAEHRFEIVLHHNEEGRRQGLNPVEHGALYTTIMRTDALKQALDAGNYDVIFGGARRDEEASRAKERIVSVRSAGHGWDPRRQRPELWSLYNWRRSSGQTLRVYPLSNWTEFDLWAYILKKNIRLCPLYFADKRPVSLRQGQRIVIDNEARAEALGLTIDAEEHVRFRSLGCWPVTAALPSTASDLRSVVKETLTSANSERNGRISDDGSLESQKQAGYF
ncbi:sulfate adenylyltransferase subunit 2 [Henriciella mobilis]|uniref:sulfate adenylyltransferase subunit CysD n=1 Tax=Henriciella mobilis TaxID=2305467 RepID=UPI000E66261D|nr:sulfate adenylyltransferase subunit CysD [Henriciella mobilis]RIJ17226.1 sulfate adenylyltransferase subunit 2 [Henriciella mobilis]RIJ22426.1 sulfate adenylyltransferase subunit 2 [Henriciella mobilis]